MQDFSTLIQNWYRLNARDLPWRSTTDPYVIWLSEIILQQTRVDQGMAYFHKFIDHYPNVHALANATEDEVLNDWQGLGYYSRARNLHISAKYISNELNGKFPADFKSILKLKGVGEYTAAAIASFSYDQPHAVIDGNVYRVLSRYLGISDPIDSAQGKKTFKEAAGELLDKKDPATHNQAVMELGALVCTPKLPKCDECPLVESCFALSKGEQLSYPVKEKKTKVKDRYLHYLVTAKDDHILLQKRDQQDIWKGLYDFPLIELEVEIGLDEEKVGLIGLKTLELDKEIKHILSHQRLHTRFWIATVDNENSLPSKYLKVRKDEIEDYPMPQLLIRYINSSSHFSAD